MKQWKLGSLHVVETRQIWTYKRRGLRVLVKGVTWWDLFSEKQLTEREETRGKEGIKRDIGPG